MKTIRFIPVIIMSLIILGSFVISTCDKATESKTGTIIFYVSEGHKNVYCLIDDRIVGICKSGEKFYFEVDAGNHELRAYSTYHMVMMTQRGGYLCGVENVNISKNESYQWEIDSEIEMGYYGGFGYYDWD